MLWLCSGFGNRLVIWSTVCTTGHNCGRWLLRKFVFLLTNWSKKPRAIYEETENCRQLDAIIGELEYSLSYNDNVGEFDSSLHKQCPYRSKHSIFRAYLELKTSNKIVVNDAVRCFSPRSSHHCREGSSQSCCVVMISAKNATRHLRSEEQEVCDSVAMNSEEQVKRQSVYNCAEICSDTISQNCAQVQLNWHHG